MTSAGGHPRIRHELSAQFRAAERGAAAPWIEEPQHPATAPLASLAAAAATLSFLHPDSVADQLHLPTLALSSALPLWLWWRAPALPTGPHPTELRGGLWKIPLALVGATVAIVALAQALDPWLVAAMAGTTMWLLFAWQSRGRADAVDRLEERLRAGRMEAPGPDGIEPAQLDPVLDAPERIGLMSVLMASSRAVHVDFLRTHLAMGESELAALIAELEQAGYIYEHTGRGDRSRCVATYAGTSATRRHRQALRQLLSGSAA